MWLSEENEKQHSNDNFSESEKQTDQLDNETGEARNNFFLSRQIERCVDRSTCNWFLVSLNQLVIFIQQSHMNVLFMFHRSRSR